MKRRELAFWLLAVLTFLLGLILGYEVSQGRFEWQNIYQETPKDDGLRLA